MSIPFFAIKKMKISSFAQDNSPESAFYRKFDANKVDFATISCVTEVLQYFFDPER